MSAFPILSPLDVSSLPSNLDGLEKLGRNIQDFEALDQTRQPAAAATPASPRTQAAQAQSGLRDLHDMWESGMRQQKQLYATVFEFELVEESSQSMMKSLKSLLTQGGG